MKIPLNELSTQGLVRLIADASKELQARLSAPIDVRLHDGRPVRTLRVSEIAQEFGEWVKRQGLPTTHNAGDWQRKIVEQSASRTKER